VEPDSIVERHIIRPMKETVKNLEEVMRSWIVDSERESSDSDRTIPEVDWGKMRSLDFQETLRSRRILEKNNSNRSCLLCPDFDIHVSTLAYIGTGFECVNRGRPYMNVVAHRGVSIFSMKSFMARRSCGKHWRTSDSQYRIRTWN
jgi:hypothetical protein